MTPQARAPSGNGLAERRLTAEHVVARALVEAATFGEAAPKILEAICDALDWEHGALWGIDREADVLRCVDIWTAASADFPEFDAASRETTFARGIGLPGRVWARPSPSGSPTSSTTRISRARTSRRAKACTAHSASRSCCAAMSSA